MLISAANALWPDPLWAKRNHGSAGSSNNASARLNASGHKLAVAFMLPPESAGQKIKTIAWRTGTVTTPQTLRIGIQPIDLSTGYPSGSYYGGSAYVTQSSPTSDTSYTATLSSMAACTPGDLVAIVWEPDSGTPDLYIGSGTVSTQNSALPVGKRYDGSAWSNNVGTGQAGAAVRYESGKPVFTALSPQAGGSSTSFNSGSGTPIVGRRIVLPFAILAQGLYAIFTHNSNTSYKLGLFVGNGLIQETAVFSGAAIGNPANSAPSPVPFPRPMWIAPGVYHIAVMPQNANNVSVGFTTLDAAGDEAGFDAEGCYATKTSLSSDWTYNTARLPSMGFVVAAFDDGRKYRGRRGA